MDERIRARAYEIWEREGRPDGREHEHWDQARREILGPAGLDPAIGTGPIGPETEETDPTTPAEGAVVESDLIPNGVGH